MCSSGVMQMSEICAVIAPGQHAAARLLTLGVAYVDSLWCTACHPRRRLLPIRLIQCCR